MEGVVGFVADALSRELRATGVAVFAGVRVCGGMHNRRVADFADIAAGAALPISRAGLQLPVTEYAASAADFADFADFAALAFLVLSARGGAGTVEASELDMGAVPSSRAHWRLAVLRRSVAEGRSDRKPTGVVR